MVRNPYALYELDQNCDSGTNINPLSAVLELSLHWQCLDDITMPIGF